MKRLFVIGAALLVPASGWGADLLDVYAEAVANDARFAAARAQREAGQEAEVQARAALLPSIGASAGTARNRVDPAGGTRSDYNNYSWGVQLTQPLFRKQSLIQSEQGALRTDLAEVQFGLAQQDLILRVSQAYFDVLNAQDALQAVQQLREAATEQLEIASSSFEIGTVTITDVHEARSRFDLATAQVIAAESELEVKRHALAQVIGRAPDELAGLRPGVEISVPQPADSAEWVDAAEQGGFGVQTQQLLREIATHEIDRARAGHLPTLDLVANHGGGERQSNSTAPRTTATSVGVQLNVPLFTGGATSSQVRESVALRDKAEAELDEARRDAALAARQAYLGVSSGLAQIKALEAAEVSSASALEANRLGYEVGVRINIDVLNAQTQLADTRRQLARARYDAVLAQLRLKAAAGVLDEEDLRLVNALLVTP